MGDTEGFLSMGVIGSKFYFNKMTLCTMWEAGGPEAELVAKESVTVLLQDFSRGKCRGP